MLPEVKSALLFVVQSVVVGLAIAFIVVLIRPDLLPVAGIHSTNLPTGYADAVDIGAPAVASIHTKRLVEITARDGDIWREIS